MSIDTFVSAYVACALWSSTDDDGEPLDSRFDDDDISVEALASMREDCTQFMEANADDLLHAGDDSQNGHDFWLTRNRHGAGFWDRGYPSGIGRRLTDAAHVWGESNLYVGDDGKVHIS
jgi:hypothetical protein